MKDKKKWAIIIPTFRRQSRLFTTLFCVAGSVYRYAHRCQIIILDTNDDRALESKLAVVLSNKRNICWSYYHCPGKNQSELRNLSLLLISDDCARILFLDSDIYISELCITKLEESFKKGNLVAVAPPLLRYKGGKHNEVRRKNKVDIQLGNSQFIMPDADDFRSAEVDANILHTKMLRGAFAIDRDFLNQTFGKMPWLPIFKVWQNVPFFLYLNEINASFGYLLDIDALALHDERASNDSISASMQNWQAETLKSIILLFYRNRLWIPVYRQLNARFVKSVASVIKKHSVKKLSLDDVCEIAKILSYSNQNRKTKFSQLMKKTNDEVLQTTFKLLLALKDSQISEIYSKDLSRKM